MLISLVIEGTGTDTTWVDMIMRCNISYWGWNFRGIIASNICTYNYYSVVTEDGMAALTMMDFGTRCRRVAI